MSRRKRLPDDFDPFSKGKATTGEAIVGTSTPTPRSSPSRDPHRGGRPPKAEGDKSVRVTTYLDPEVVTALDAEIDAHNRRATSKGDFGAVIPPESGRGRFLAVILADRFRSRRGRD